MMGISLFLVWNKKNMNAIYIFSGQLYMNMFWSIMFFGFKSIFYALIDIIILWIAILATIIVFYKINRKAAWLLVPYLAWVTLATLLNFYIWKLNPA